MKKIITTTLITASVLLYANEASTELEHAIKTAPSDESISEDMSKMKAMGKCGGDQKMSQHTHTKTNQSKADLELEHAIKTAPSDESVSEDMSQMKAMGKCGTGK